MGVGVEGQHVVVQARAAGELARAVLTEEELDAGVVARVCQELVGACVELAACTTRVPWSMAGGGRSTEDAPAELTLGVVRICVYTNVSVCWQGAGA